MRRYSSDKFNVIHCLVYVMKKVPYYIIKLSVKFGETELRPKQGTLKILRIWSKTISIYNVV